MNKDQIRNTTRRSFSVSFVLALAATATLGIAAPASDLRLPHIFGNGIVLQQGKPVSVWGWAKPGSQVTIQCAGQTKSATATADSKWQVQLDAMNASFTPGSLVVRADDQKLALDDILVGELWVCGGQSNMERTLNSTRDADLELVAADYQSIRFIRLPKIAHIEPQDDFPVESATNPIGNWRAATAKQVECTARTPRLRSGWPSPLIVCPSAPARSSRPRRTRPW